jgi:hypothetical protein
MTSLETAKHAASDLAYLDGLVAHIASGGEVSDRNLSDLIAMARWNAEHLIECIGTKLLLPGAA